jgi:hypothetical protein
LQRIFSALIPYSSCLHSHISLSSIISSPPKTHSEPAV